MHSRLRENKIHGTPGYPYSHYSTYGIPGGFQVPVHWHDELEIIYVQKGRLEINVGGTDYELRDNQVVIVNPQQLHMLASEDLSICYHALLFPVELISFQSSDDLEQTVFRPLRTGKRALPTWVPEAVLTPENLELLDRVVKINDQKSSVYQLETRVLLLRFLLEVLRCGPLVRTEASESGKMQREMLEYIRIHYRERLSLEDLAEQFHLSPKYLSRYFKEHFHLTLSQHISHLRLNHARELLETTDLSVTDIAMQSGFSGVSFFIRSFTEANGISPLKWRKVRTGIDRQEKQVYD